MEKNQNTNFDADQFVYRYVSEDQWDEREEYENDEMEEEREVDKTNKRQKTENSNLTVTSTQIKVEKQKPLCVSCKDSSQCSVNTDYFTCIKCKQNLCKNCWSKLNKFPIFDPNHNLFICKACSQ